MDDTARRDSHENARNAKNNDRNRPPLSIENIPLGSPPPYDEDSVAPKVAKPPPPPRRQSSFAQPRPNGTPRTPNRVRFNMSPTSSESARADNSPMELADEAALFREMNDMDVDGDGSQRMPLLTGLEAPTVALATEDEHFNAEDLLESARPKSGVCSKTWDLKDLTWLTIVKMSSAFMNMANSIM